MGQANREHNFVIASEFTGHLLTTSSLLIAVATFVVGFLSKRRTDRLTRTLTFIREIYERDGPIRKANLELAMWLSHKKSLHPSDLDINEEKTLVVLLDYFDLIADSANRGIVDPEMIVTHLGGKMRSIFLCANEYILSKRGMLNRPNLYNPLESFLVGHVGEREV